ncbi:hypothetical protein RFI_03740 [Reticulomyxa filosa]|uniref:Uncharacterized protein n=1 Tax=Reticulomyxa filosa TaxID=46433 RepID=X6P4B0_RETFI|nr:hypothetical protein RFI_03740 [Reticulomyxa filosa]|eukprot:ETO33365.1 hypothetical protein RFI_03740 [Reticulomyxa filosa]
MFLFFEETTKDVLSSSISSERCFDKAWIQATNSQNRVQDYVCLICQQIAKNAIQLVCFEHEQLDDGLIVGENLICPLQYQLNVRASSQCQESSEEGQVTSTGHNLLKKCEFKGKLKDVKEHLEKLCPLKLMDCYFKPFGCHFTSLLHELQDHLSSHSQIHINLKKRINSFKFYFVLFFKTIWKGIIFLYFFLLKKKKKGSDPKKDKEIVELTFSKVLKYLFFFFLSINQSIKKKKEEMTVEIRKLREEIERYQLLLKSKETLQKKERQLSKSQEDAESPKKYFGVKDEYRLQLTKLIVTPQEHKEQDNGSPAGRDDPLFNYSLLPPCATSPISKSFDLMRTFKTITGHEGVVWSVQFSPFDGGRSIISGSDDKTIRLWDTQSGKQLQIFHGHMGSVYCVQFSPFHRSAQSHSYYGICSSSMDKSIRFWNIQTGKQFQIFDGHTRGVNCITFSPFDTGRILCSGSLDKTIRLWDVHTCKTLHTFDEHTNYVNCVQFSPLRNNETAGNRSYCGSGYTICSGSSDNTIGVWDIQTTKQITSFTGHEALVSSVQYSPFDFGNIICSGSWDNTIRLWDIRNKKQIQIIKGHEKKIRCVQFLPFQCTNACDNATNVELTGGSVICSGSADNTIRFWDLELGRNYIYCGGHEGDINNINSLLFKRDDGWFYGICSASWDKTIRLWGSK